MRREFQLSVLVILLSLLLLIFTGCSTKDSIGEFQSVTGLYESCPGECGSPSTCEGKPAKVWGYLDVHNVFEDPQGGNEKARFVIAGELDDQGFGTGKVIEVIPNQESDQSALFDKLETIDATSKVFTTGTVTGYDAPTNLSCERLISLEIDGENSVEIR